MIEQRILVQMQILVITREFPPYVLGGISYHLEWLYNAVANMGHEITIVSGSCRQAKYKEPNYNENMIDLEWVPYLTPTANHIQFPPKLFTKLRKMDLSRFDVAIKHTEVPYNLGIPTISKKHDCKDESLSYLRSEFGLSKQILDRVIQPSRSWITQRSLYHTDHFIFNSRLTREAWHSHYDISTTDTVIYNGVDTTIFYPRSIDSEEYVLFVGDSERKGLSYISDLADGLSCTIKVVGSEPIEGPNIEFLGRVSSDQLARLYSGASATIHPAKFEAFGNVVLESLACGTPVVTTPSCGASEILNSAGIVTTDFLKGIESCKNISSHTCVSCAKQFTWEKVAEKTIDIVQNHVKNV